MDSGFYFGGKQRQGFPADDREVGLSGSWAKGLEKMKASCISSDTGFASSVRRGD